MAHRISKEELDEQFEQFLKESLSDDSFGSSNKASVLETLGRPRKKEIKKKEPSRAPWWINDDDDAVDSELLGTNQSFLKSSRTSQPIEEEDEDADKPQHQQTDLVSVSISRDSLETDDSVVASGPNQGVFGIGLDTLEEQEEKERFFARLERGASSTIDYSRLNKELDSADSIQLAALIRNEENEKTPPHDTKDDLKHEDMSGNYSEDFEDEADTSVATKKEENQDEPFVNTGEILSRDEQREEKPGMLAKVLLLDSLESSMETQKLLEQQAVTSVESAAQQGTNEISTTGISYGQTNSDIEALHRAYQHIDQSMGDTNEQKVVLDVAEDTNYSFQDVLNTHENVRKNISTTDSDLPTVEELMKPIRGGPAFARGFDLEPVSLLTDAGSRPDKPEIQLQSEQQQSVTAEQKLRDGFLTEWHNKEKRAYPRAATNEVNVGSNRERIIRDHTVDNVQHGIYKPHECQDDVFLPQDNDRHQVSNHSSKLWETYAVNSKQVTFKTKKSSSFLPKKPQGGHYASVRSSGYGKTSSPLKQLAAFGEKQTTNESVRRSNLKAKVPPDQARRKGTLSALKSVKSTKNEAIIQDENGLFASTHAYIKGSEQHISMADGHMQSDNVNLVVDVSQSIHEQDSPLNVNRNTQQELYLREKINELETKWRAEHILLEHLKMEFSQKEKDLELKMQAMKEQQERELLLLKQDNYILQTKLHCGEEKSKKSKKVLEEIQGPINEERLKEIQKEIKEQEELLQGYQQENEKLYHQVKELQDQNKKNEERMFKENQNLLAELATVKEQKATSHVQKHFEQDSEQVRHHSFTELISELRAAQRVQADLSEELKRLKQDKQSLEVDIGQMRKERDLAKAQIIHTSGDKSYAMKIMEESYKQEILRLNKRLQWFAENQELLDKDAGRLRDASKEIEMLKIEVQKLKAEAGNRSEQQQRRLKDRAADAKRIQDLERQVKEMEGIIKRRHPNSLPALIYAAATASEADDKSLAKPHTTVFLERRIQKLESDLEGKDEEAKKSLRSMEQQFQKIKIQYEQRITELEQLLSYKFTNEPPKGPEKTASHTALEQELFNLKEVHQNTEAHLLREIEMLKNRNAGLEIKSREIEDQDFHSIEQQVEQANVNARLVRLNQELAVKSKEVQGLSKTVERLQKERMAMLSDHTTNSKADSRQKLRKKAKRDIQNTLKDDFETTDPFPRTLDEKAYQPNTFTDTHISEVLQENEKLKNKLERLSAGNSQQKTQWQIAVSLAESNLKRAKEETAEQIAALKSSHQRELEKIICQHAVEYSSSRVAELSSKNSSQEILIKHLQDQVNELQRDRESLAITRVREEILQTEMAKLLEELREAKESHTPEMKHFQALENKIKHMENRHAQREQELQQLIRQTRYVAEVEQTHEVEKWRKLAHMKNQELEKFRVDLDSILDVLRELQRQGVVIPAPSSDPSNLPEIFWKT